MNVVSQGLGPDSIREKLRDWARSRLGVCSSDVLINELGFVNRADNSSVDNTYRADLALANGRLVGFEIKSAADTLKRWSDQQPAYFRVFDEVWICCHGKHLAKVLESATRALGIIVIDDFGSLAVVKAAGRNTGVDPYDLSGLLWREELDLLCQTHGIKVNSRATKKSVRQIVTQEVALESLRNFVLARLKDRKNDGR